jgi:hypothetical protein
MAKQTIEVEIKDVWVAWTNTDLTEGRGRLVPLAVCELETTAIRLGRKGSVMGSDCDISKEPAVFLGCWLVPGVIQAATGADRTAQVALTERRSAEAKAKAAGLTDAEIKALRGQA